MEWMEYTKTYQEYKQELDAVLTRTAEDFVQIGYLLKVARDTNILAESGYANVTDFAKAEYGIDKTQVSRFISINDRFSENGYSDHLMTNYQGFGYAKLTLMLQIPDEINEVLPTTLSKAEIQEIKDEVVAENQISEIEVEIEKAEAAAVTDKPMLPPDGTPLYRNLWQLGKEQEDLFRKLWAVCSGTHPHSAEIMDILIPQGDAVYSVRIPGERRTQIIVNSNGATLVNMKTLESDQYTEDELCETIWNLWNTGSSPEETYRTLYGMDLENEEVAPVQQDASKKEKRKESKVTKANPSKTKTVEKKQEQMEIPGAEQAPKEAETQGTAPCSGDSDTDLGMEAEEQIPGQDTIFNHPEYMPDEQLNDQPWKELWEELQDKAAGLDAFANHLYTLKDLEDNEISKKTLEHVYNDALAVAAMLERVLNGKKYHA